jgi:hypothetical protein
MGRGAGFAGDRPEGSDEDIDKRSIPCPDKESKQAVTRILTD